MGAVARGPYQTLSNSTSARATAPMLRAWQAVEISPQSHAGGPSRSRSTSLRQAEALGPYSSAQDYLVSVTHQMQILQCHVVHDPDPVQTSKRFDGKQHLVIRKIKDGLIAGDHHSVIGRYRPVRLRQIIFKCFHGDMNKCSVNFIAGILRRPIERVRCDPLSHLMKGSPTAT
jgi:hypothetical protein